MSKPTTPSPETFPVIEPFAIANEPFDKITQLAAELRAAPDDEPTGVRERRRFAVAMLQATALVLCEWKRGQHAQNVAAPFLRAAKRLETVEPGEPPMGPRGKVPATYHKLVARLGTLVAHVELAADTTPDGSLEALLGMIFQVHRAAKFYGVASDGRNGLHHSVTWTPKEKITEHGGHFGVHVSTLDEKEFTAEERQEIRDAESAAWSRIVDRKIAAKAAKGGAA